MALAPPFTSKDKILLWFRRITAEGEGLPMNELIAYLKFGQPYSAKKFLEVVIGDFDTEELTPTTTRVRNWFNIVSDCNSSHTTAEILAYKYTKEEAKWQLSQEYRERAEYIHKFRRGSHPEEATRGTSEEGKHVIRANVEQKMIERASKYDDDKLPTKTKERKPRAPSQKREALPGHVTVATVAERIKMDPREARGILRDKSTKPAHGWSWPEKDLKPIIALLEKNRKKK